MKVIRILRTTCVTGVIVASLCACKSDRLDNAPPPKGESSILVQSLKTINQELLASGSFLTRSPEEQSSTDVILKSDNWKGILVADAIGAWDGAKSGGSFGSSFGPSAGVAGAIIGGLVGAAIGSAIAAWVDDAGTNITHNPIGDWIESQAIYNPITVYSYYVTIEDEFLKEVEEKAAISLTMDEKYPMIAKVGAMHNAILEKILSVNNIPIYNDVDSASFAYRFLTSSEFTSEWRATVDECLKGDNTKYEHAKSGYTPTASQVIDLFTQIYMEYPDTENGAEILVNTYFEKIEASAELSQAEKEYIYTGLSVAAYTPKLWDEKIR